MAIPAAPFVLAFLSKIGTVARLPALVGFFVAVFLKGLKFLIIFKAAKVLYRLAVLGVLVALYFQLLDGIYSIFNQLTLVIPPELQQAINVFMPSSVPYCITAITTVKVMKWVFDWKYYLIDEATKA